MDETEAKDHVQPIARADGRHPQIVPFHHHGLPKTGGAHLPVELGQARARGRTREAGSALMLTIWALLLMSLTMISLVEYVTSSGEEAVLAAAERVSSLLR